jgi:ribokinase
MFRKKERKKPWKRDELDKEKILNDIRRHFAEITTEEFIKNVERSCPELYWDESQFPPTSFTRAVKRRKEQSHSTDSQTYAQGEVRMNTHKPKVAVVGSLNVDLVIKTERRPQKGETLIGEEFGIFTGGKGFNQAIAAARLGAEVTLIGRMGTDLFGDMLQSAMAENKIDTDFVSRDGEVGTGIASIIVDADGDNRIIVVPRANMRLSVEDVERAADRIAAADVLLLQLEVPVDASQRAAEIARAGGATVILNPAPARELPDSFLAQVDILTPNETETEFLSGIQVSDDEGAACAAQVLLDKGISTVVLTLGKRGALLLTRDMKKLVPAYTVNVVDTTAAGDAFCGALGTALAQGKTIEAAVAYANAAGALAVTVLGAEPAIPTAEQIAAFLKRV